MVKPNNVQFLSSFIDRFSKGKQSQHILQYLLSLVLVIYVYRSTSFLPFQDEIDDYLNFVIQILDQGLGHPYDLYRASFRTIHNLFLYKLMYFAQYRIVHYLDFRLLPVLGCMAYCIAVFKLTDRPSLKLPFKWFVIPCLIFFIPLYQVHNWGMVSAGSLFRLLLVLLGASYLFSKSSSSFWGLILVLFLSIQSGTGVLVFIALICSASLYFKSVTRSKIVLLILGAIFAALVFSWRTIEASPPDITSYYKYFRSMVEYVLATYGSVFQSILEFDQRYFCVLLGLILLLVLTWQLYLNRASVLKDPIFGTTLIYLLIVPVLGASQRWYFSYHHALSDRFVIYSLLILGVIAFLLTKTLINRNLTWIALILQASFLIFAVQLIYLNGEKIYNHRMMLEEGYTNLVADSTIETVYMDKPHGDRFKGTLTKAINHEIFDVPNLFCSEIKRDQLEASTFRKISVSELEFAGHRDRNMLYLHLRADADIMGKRVGIMFRKVFSNDVYKVMLNQYRDRYFGMVDISHLPVDLADYSIYVYLEEPDALNFMGDLNLEVKDLRENPIQ
ncbi:MAG: hypothetical protein IPL46_30720 [Saprospiraceae bacterium]|nr:hypothetical protein [Saprospiraceae bacterium]